MADQPRIRLRLLAVALACFVVAASGVFLDRAVQARENPSASIEAATTGAWYCPHGGSPGWQGWVVVTNPGSSTVRIRLTQATQGLVRSVGTFTVGPPVYLIAILGRVLRT